MRVKRSETSFGTLLGPEKTPAVWWGFLGEAAPGLDRLTHPLLVGTLVSVVGVVVVVVGWGVVVC
jgi:hypothetical protein